MIEGIGMGEKLGPERVTKKSFSKDETWEILWSLPCEDSEVGHPRQREQQDKGPEVNPISTLGCITIGGGCKAPFLCAVMFTVSFSKASKHLTCNQNKLPPEVWYFGTTFIQCGTIPLIQIG